MHFIQRSSSRSMNGFPSHLLMKYLIHTNNVANKLTQRHWRVFIKPETWFSKQDGLTQVKLITVWKCYIKTNKQNKTSEQTNRRSPTYRVQIHYLRKHTVVLFYLSFSNSLIKSKTEVMLPYCKMVSFHQKRPNSDLMQQQYACI